MSGANGERASEQSDLKRFGIPMPACLFVFLPVCLFVCLLVTHVRSVSISVRIAHHIIVAHLLQFLSCHVPNMQGLIMQVGKHVSI